MQYLVLLSYGREAEYRRALFAALSFWARYRGPQQAVRTLVFTDCPAFFEPYLAGLPVDYVPLEVEQRRAMQGPHHYVHRVKVAVLDEVQQVYPGRSLLYCDSDTFFQSDPGPLLRWLAAGTAFMHQPEYTFEEAPGIYASFDQAEYPRRFLELIAGCTFRVAGRARQLLRTQQAWNSGVLGLPATAAPLLPDVYALTDAFYAATGWFTAEQLAFSVALPLQFPLLRSDQYVFHYWGPRQKELMDARLAHLLTATFAHLPLPARLAAVRPLTARWRRQLELDRMREGALYAFGKGQLLTGARYAAKALLQAPLDLSFPRQVLHTLRGGTAAQA
ncbi:hypothetical protein [Hymenobacter sp. CRA2]|uniref:hypothetical protein n=1 Tax=Hymenobacter sp. CRA2 TaxID=1955620 RepID=UPI00098E93AB|nr:hypothetical protein [Hymenobacter sp. CRA2]OON67584.1 hypothetical protein B0919_17305 [Hymenobacter sp. CRA2]